MREAVGSAFIVNLILIFIGVISALLIGSISYSKAYKIKDRIIYTIEKYDGWSDATKNEIDKQINAIGYKLNDGNSSKCPSILSRRYGNYDPKKLVHGANLGVNQYNYCVYENNYESAPGKYYTVITFMTFDIPLIGGLLQFPVSGETSVIYEVINN